jgi:hypothetical protein
MKPADAYLALHDAAGSPLRLWMQSNRPAFDAAVRKGATEASEGHGMRVVGPPAWKQRVLHALDLLRRYSAEVFGFVRQYADVVQHAEQSGMGIRERTIYIADATADASAEWLASVFAHEAYHAYLRLSGLYPEYGKEAEEQECNAYQLRVLRGLNAREKELAHLSGQTGGHYRTVFSGSVRYNPCGVRRSP